MAEEPAVSARRQQTRYQWHLLIVRFRHRLEHKVASTNSISTYLEGHHEVLCVLGLVRGQVLQHLRERAEELQHALFEGRPVLLVQKRITLIRTQTCTGTQMRNIKHINRSNQSMNQSIIEPSNEPINSPALETAAQALQ